MCACGSQRPTASPREAVLAFRRLGGCRCIVVNQCPRTDCAASGTSHCTPVLRLAWSLQRPARSKLSGYWCTCVSPRKLSLCQGYSWCHVWSRDLPTCRISAVNEPSGGSGCGERLREALYAPQEDAYSAALSCGSPGHAMCWRELCCNLKKGGPRVGALPGLRFRRLWSWRIRRIRVVRGCICDPELSRGGRMGSCCPPPSRNEL